MENTDINIIETDGLKGLEIFKPEAGIEKPEKPVRVLGIDLGTTNSTAAEIIWDPREDPPLNITTLEIDQETQEGVSTSILVPSVAANYKGKTYIGEGAKRLRGKAPLLKLKKNRDLFYECKNDMGLEFTYHKAPEGFRCAAEIGGKVLEFIKKQALELDDTPIDRAVVTVPASFELAQRTDTKKAGRIAGFEIESGDLLDEPVAAFIDFMLKKGKTILDEFKEPRDVLIFDFGGGTCDIAIFKIQHPQPAGPLNIQPLSVSRYHRLGGGDIDRAIIYKILIPQLMEQNNLPKFSLSFDDKKNYIEPALLSVAEALKINMCKEIYRLMAFGKYKDADKSEIVQTYPGFAECKTSKKETFKLVKPKLTAKEFEEVLEPFLELDFLYPFETEYRVTCSIFAPLNDSLEKCLLHANEIDMVLMVGGSSLNPLLKKPLEENFENGRICFDNDIEAIQAGVARGAAFNALSRELFGKGLVQAVCHDSISIQTRSGAQNLIPPGSVLPYPSDGDYKIYDNLAAPETAFFEPTQLRIEIVGGDMDRVLYRRVYPIKEMINKGDILCLEYRMDENQVLDMKLYPEKNPDYKILSEHIENPLTNVVNIQSEKMKILELEEAIRKGKISKRLLPDKIFELGKLYADTGKSEKAMDFFKRALRFRNDDPEILNRMGILAGEMGDYKREEKYYQRAINSSNCTYPLFNLIFSQLRRGNFVEAQANAEELVKRECDSPNLVLKAQTEEKLKNMEARDADLEKALKIMGPISVLSDWELGWCLTGARMLGDKENISKISEERKRRKLRGALEDKPEGELPDTGPRMERV